MFEVMLSGIFKAIGLFIVAVLVQHFFAEGVKDKAESHPKDRWGKLFGWLVICLVAAFFYVSILGTHTENCDDDPLYGRCDRVQDREVSSNERTREFTAGFLVLFVPYAYGFLVENKQKDIFYDR